jgi:hypothetical protein
MLNIKQRFKKKVNERERERDNEELMLKKLKREKGA